MFMCHIGQPKLVINNIDVLRNATLNDDSSVCASMYHDSLIWRIIALGANERCLPVILVTSDRLVPFLFSYVNFLLAQYIIQLTLLRGVGEAFCLCLMLLHLKRDFRNK